MNIAFIPIDNRPVCYTLPEQICAVDKGISLFLPDRNLLGDLTKYADAEKILNWLENLDCVDAVILSLDTIAYGGLISSRRCSNTFEEIKQRIHRLFKILESKKSKVYAFSSIMRISNNNVNEEEKEYWNLWGKKIFEYSYNTHKLEKFENDVPKEILDDYLKTRKRNFEINKIYLEFQKRGLFSTLVFSKDDCAEYGLNVMEAQELEKLGGFVKTGADEIPLTLLARAVSDFNKKLSLKLKVAPIFLSPKDKSLISNYEDVSIENSVKGQLELAGCEICSHKDADILLYVNNFENRQGEIVMKIPTKPYEGEWAKQDKPYMIADVRFANGSDNSFVKKLFGNDLEQFDDNFYGYSAWNTSANTLGSLICIAVVKFYSNISSTFSPLSFKKLQVVRFLDDWAYQANVRQDLVMPDEDLIKQKMKPFETLIFEKLGVNFNTSYKFPWNRLFEVEVELS